ncbi:MAG: chorismate-binding protein [Micrococcaceae bacterium]
MKKIYSHTLHDMDEWFDIAKNSCHEFVWIREDSLGENFQKFAFGELVSRETSTISELQQWWQHLSDENSAQLTSFVSIAFDKTSSWKCKASIPQFLFEQTARGKSITFFSFERINIESMGELLQQLKDTKQQQPGILEETGKSLSDQNWMDVVSQALDLMKSTELEKIVLSRKVSYSANVPIATAEVLNKLRQHYRQCWVYGYQGFVGATPEMLVEVHDRTAKARVLAGTQSRSIGEEPTLLESKKELNEHQLAIDSLAETLQTASVTLKIEGPFTLELPNVWHLASDVKATLNTPVHILELVKKLHPTAAVGGTPRNKAVALINELENYDRGPYTGPVGWMNSQGEGQFGIALRCGLINGNNIDLYAGCGIVPGSDPVKELAETEHKMLPMRQALRELFA